MYGFQTTIKIPVTRNNFLLWSSRQLNSLCYSPAFRSAIGRSEREGILSSTTSIEINQLDPQPDDCRVPVYSKEFFLNGSYVFRYIP